MWRFVTAFLGALVTVSWRRLRRHPVHRAWPPSFEMLVETMRRFSRSVAGLSPVELRTAMAALPVALEKGVRVSSEDGVTRFTPDGATRVILYLHGGGYVFGSAMADGALASSLASHAHRIVVAPDYRLAPEHPCPAALDDARRAYQDLLDRGVAPEDIVIAGLSSGGGLALALAARLRDEGAPMPDALVLLSPLLDATATRPSWVENARYDWGDREMVIGWARRYAGDLPLDDPRVSPGRGDLRGLPRMLVVTGELELGRDDATALVDQGATLLVGPAMVHAYVTFKEVPAAKKALEDVARFARLDPTRPAPRRSPA